jgi:hypothetical protein
MSDRKKLKDRSRKSEDKKPTVNREIEHKGIERLC